jgi:hypothetical protein
MPRGVAVGVGAGEGCGRYCSRARLQCVVLYKVCVQRLAHVALCLGSACGSWVCVCMAACATLGATVRPGGLTTGMHSSSCLRATTAVFALAYYLLPSIGWVLLVFLGGFRVHLGWLAFLSGSLAFRASATRADLIVWV